MSINYSTKFLDESSQCMHSAQRKAKVCLIYPTQKSILRIQQFQISFLWEIMLNISALSLPLDIHTRLGKKQNYLSLDDALHAI